MEGKRKVLRDAANVRICAQRLPASEEIVLHHRHREDDILNRTEAKAGAELPGCSFSQLHLKVQQVVAGTSPGVDIDLFEVLQVVEPLTRPA